MERIVKKLTELNKTISTMESCTGGGVVNEITNIEGASEVLKFSAVTYSNEYKIKMGVSEKVISKYSVYSFETAKEMSFNISKFSDSDYGVGITGKLNRIDKNNLSGSDSTIFISVYDKDNDKYYLKKLEAIFDSRCDNKNLVIENVIKLLCEVLEI